MLSVLHPVSDAGDAGKRCEKTREIENINFFFLLINLNLIV